jgi:CTP:molybdopterin cytidylyltransferase MocA
MRTHRYHALIAAAGTGSRFASETPKQYALLEGKPVLQHAIDRLAAGLPLHRIYVALAPEDRWYDRAIRAQAGVARFAAAARRARRRSAARSMRLPMRQTTTGSSSTMRRDPASIANRLRVCSASSPTTTSADCWPYRWCPR